MPSPAHAGRYMQQRRNTPFHSAPSTALRSDARTKNIAQRLNHRYSDVCRPPVPCTYHRRVEHAENTIHTDTPGHGKVVAGHGGKVKFNAPRRVQELQRLAVRRRKAQRPARTRRT